MVTAADNSEAAFRPLWQTSGFAASNSVAIGSTSVVTLGESEYGESQSMALTFLDAKTGAINATLPTPGAVSLMTNGDLAVVSTDDRTAFAFNLATARQLYSVTGVVARVSPSHLILDDGSVLDATTGNLQRKLTIAGSIVGLAGDGAIAVYADDADHLNAVNLDNGLPGWTVNGPATPAIEFDDTVWVAGSSLRFADGQTASAPAATASTQGDIVDAMGDYIAPQIGCGSSRYHTAGFYPPAACSDEVVMQFPQSPAEGPPSALLLDSMTTVELSQCGAQLNESTVTVIGHIVFCLSDSGVLHAVNATNGVDLAQVPVPGVSYTASVVSDGHLVVVFSGDQSDQSPNGDVYGEASAFEFDAS